MRRAADQHVALGAQDLRGLVEHDLDRARVLALVRGQLAGSWTGLDILQRHDRALGLGDDLVRDHEDLTVRQSPWRLLRPQRRDDQPAEVVSGANLRETAHGAGAQAVVVACHRRPVSRSRRWG